jgi:methylthioribulose-1-phosphate dehydratase
MLHSDDLRESLSWVIGDIHAKGWARGTGGNFSALYQREPLALLMAPSGVDKGLIAPESLIVVDRLGKVLEGQGRSSAETLIHLAIIETLNAQVVLHTHSVFGTLLSMHYASVGQFTLSGYEMLKGFEGVRSHEAQVNVPILPNSQDMATLSDEIRVLLETTSGLYGFLLAGHGLYTWGDSLFQARRHVEIFEFFFELHYHQLNLVAKSSYN